MADRIRLLAGTSKGAFVLTSDARRVDWDVSGPHCDGWPINHVIGDPASDRLWAAGGGGWEGAGVWRSEDGGRNWVLSRLANGARDAWIAESPGVAAQFGLSADPPAPFTEQVEAIWSLCLSADALFAGAKPADLFESVDGGRSWTRVRGLADAPDREAWEPGGAGLVLHSIVAHPAAPRRLWIGISAAGLFATEDGGATWERRDRRANLPPEEAASPAPGHDPSRLGGCVHNFVRADAEGDLLYQQNHHGVFRSPDGGRGWVEITAGLPSTFGFPIAVHPRDPRTIWVLPLNGDMAGRYPPDASAAVWRSRDGGGSWSACRRGLPASNCFFTVLRQAMAVDRFPQVGVYFGTNSGSVFASVDEGEEWREVARHLPTVLSLETLQAP